MHARHVHCAAEVRGCLSLLLCTCTRTMAAGCVQGGSAIFDALGAIAVTAPLLPSGQAAANSPPRRCVIDRTRDCRITLIFCRMGSGVPSSIAMRSFAPAASKARPRPPNTRKRHGELRTGSRAGHRAKHISLSPLKGRFAVHAMRSDIFHPAEGVPSYPFYESLPAHKSASLHAHHGRRLTYSLRQRTRPAVTPPMRVAGGA